MAVNINGKDYDEANLSPELRNTIIARQELLQSKVRHQIELEKIDVLTDHFNKKIENMIKDVKPLDEVKKD